MVQAEGLGGGVEDWQAVVHAEGLSDGVKDGEAAPLPVLLLESEG